MPKTDPFDLRKPKALCVACRKVQTRGRCNQCHQPLCVACAVSDEHECPLPAEVDDPENSPL